MLVTGNRWLSLPENHKVKFSAFRKKRGLCCLYYLFSLNATSVLYIPSGPGNLKTSFCTTLPSGPWLDSVQRRNLQKISRQKKHKCFTLLALGMRQVLVVSGSCRWRGNRVEVFRVQRCRDDSFQPSGLVKQHMSADLVYTGTSCPAVLDFQLSTLGH